ncbi:MAG: hypothetical protein QME82_09775, partial [Bacillota bacterium]|nr:hypothetical protein [Bacillota bacterium]
AAAIERMKMVADAYFQSRVTWGVSAEETSLPLPAEDYVNLGLALLLEILAPSQARSSTAECIQYTDPGRLTLGSSHIPTQRVVELMTEMRGMPLPVASAVDRFKAIPAVEGVCPKVDAHRNHATLCVVVRMPKYDDALMNRLIAEEAKASEFAKKHGYVLEFMFVPKELAGSPDLDDDGCSCFLD